jgi:glycosyltransferase involved in cell wall biosynthesis
MTELSSTVISEAVLNKLEEIYPSVIISGALAYASGALAIRYSNKNNIPLIVFDDAKIQDVKRSKHINWIKKQLFSGVDAIFCPASEWDATFKFFGFQKEQLFYGVNAIDNNFFNKTVDNTNMSFPSLPKGYFLNIGRQIEKKNLIILLKSYKLIKESKSEIPDLVLVGEGDSRIDLEKYAQKYGLDNIHFLNFQNQETIVGLYQNASLFILPSLYAETWGLVVNEAMASGLPVAASFNVGCAHTLVGENKNGFKFDPLDAYKLAEKLVWYNSLPSKDKNRMSDASKKEIQLWGLDNFSEGLLSALNYIEIKPKRKISISGKIISLFWKGRYRPI